jgi:hypothetical protein
MGIEEVKTYNTNMLKDGIEEVKNMCFLLDLLKITYSIQEKNKGCMATQSLPS